MSQFQPQLWPQKPLRSLIIISTSGPLSSVTITLSSHSIKMRSSLLHDFVQYFYFCNSFLILVWGIFRYWHSGGRNVMGVFMKQYLDEGFVLQNRRKMSNTFLLSQIAAITLGVGSAGYLANKAFRSRIQDKENPIHSLSVYKAEMPTIGQVTVKNIQPTKQNHFLELRPVVFSDQFVITPVADYEIDQ